MLDCDTAGGYTTNVPKWGDGPRANKLQSDNEPMMKTTMVFDSGLDCFFYCRGEAAMVRIIFNRFLTIC